MIAGITTAPRDKPTLNRSIESLTHAGLDPRVWLDGNGAPFRAWLLLARQLVISSLGQFPILMCQDDIVVAKGLGEFLDAHFRYAWPSTLPQNIGCVSLYCPSKYAPEDPPKDPVWQPWWGAEAWGACCLLFNPVDLKAIIESDTARKWPHKAKIDSFVGQALREIGKELIYYSPSLVQHIGETSTLGDFPAAGWRQASDFVGEDFEDIKWPKTELIGQ